MPFETFTTPSGFVLPSFHSMPAFFTMQKYPDVLSSSTRQWITLILAYARHQRLWTLRVEDANVKEGGDWSEIFWNPRVRRQMRTTHLDYLISTMVAEGSAIYEPPKQTQSVIVCWKKVDEWAETLFDWVESTGQLNTILTHYEIQEPPVASPLSDIPLTLLTRAIQVLVKTGRAQQIEGTEGGGAIRFFNPPVR
ncbi:hypothetical protein FRB93_000784 [Tulasnella sp. JGI-2019a]|nr:hypothetical protein FRB93_000784 [Tulasnella sp. JGI-2019a]